jgi:hypothetical protein
MLTVCGSHIRTTWLSDVIKFLDAVLTLSCHLISTIGLPYLKITGIKQFRLRIRSSGNNSVSFVYCMTGLFPEFPTLWTIDITSNENEYLCWTSRMRISYWKCSKRHSSTHQENNLVILAKIDTESGIETRSIGSKNLQHIHVIFCQNWSGWP